VLRFTCKGNFSCEVQLDSRLVQTSYSGIVSMWETMWDLETSGVPCFTVTKPHLYPPSPLWYLKSARVLIKSESRQCDPGGGGGHKPQPHKP